MVLISFDTSKISRWSFIYEGTTRTLHLPGRNRGRPTARDFGLWRMPGVVGPLGSYGGAATFS